ncbi:MaoC/PaaZ C-terminal domain-containing protein [Pseudaminobacter soli (ex Li et al. 2025)]|uniref:Acyl dehydratase n=1 Tax=Pseudaminobacter soli (ex Li et al. 2025) TaxID=1295366 RepID=A0A2P7SK89_9HYPH|nr:MaoC/PaaZ C-terminal domain-containing protein [Mesorhizobium soli]PSJ62909.1 acyl dehydratase [Mesorhizobium soli]
MSLFFDDIRVGQEFQSGSQLVNRDDILDFAKVFDPNPFHSDDEAARAVGYPGIMASGLHTLSLSFRLFFDLHLWDDSVMPSPGIDKVRWLKPLYGGQEIRIKATVIEVTASRSKSDRGIVRLLHETMETASQDVIFTAEGLHRLRRRLA